MRRVPSLLGALLLVATAAQPSSAATPTGNSTGGVLPPDPGSQQDPAFVIAKEQGRVRVFPNGRVEILSTAPAVSYSSSVKLDTSWTGSVWEPQGSGTDDASQPYTDNNYWNFCGPGATAVALWYWYPAGNTFDTSTTLPLAQYREPNYTNLATWATTSWKGAESGVSNGRGAIMYLAENEWPAPGGTYRQWLYPGVIDWTSSYPNDGTPVNRIRDALNWEISGTVTGPYAWRAYTASLTQSALHTDVLGDLASLHPLVANVATSSGRYNLPNWGKRGSVNHSITIVGYDDAKGGTYTYIDTCGPGCNNSGSPAGVYHVSQQTLWVLLGAETDHDGIIF